MERELLVWNAYRSLHAYAAQHPLRLASDSPWCPPHLPKKPVVPSQLAPCHRLLTILPDVRMTPELPGDVPDETLLGWVLWSRWLSMSTPVWTGPEEGWKGLVWRPLASFVPPISRLEAVLAGWDYFWRRQLCLGTHTLQSDVDVRFPLPSPVEPPLRAKSAQAREWIRILRGVCAQHPDLDIPQVLRFLRPDGSEKDGLGTGEWPLDLLAACPEFWEPQPTSDPWIWEEAKLPEFLLALRVVGAQRVIQQLTADLFSTGVKDKTWAARCDRIADGIESAAQQFEMEIRNFRRTWDALIEEEH